MAERCVIMPMRAICARSTLKVDVESHPRTSAPTARGQPQGWIDPALESAGYSTLITSPITARNENAAGPRKSRKMYERALDFVSQREHSPNKLRKRRPDKPPPTPSPSPSPPPPDDEGSTNGGKARRRLSSFLSKPFRKGVARAGDEGGPETPAGAAPLAEVNDPKNKGKGRAVEDPGLPYEPPAPRSVMPLNVAMPPMQETPRSFFVHNPDPPLPRPRSQGSRESSRHPLHRWLRNDSAVSSTDFIPVLEGDGGEADSPEQPYLPIPLFARQPLERRHSADGALEAASRGPQLQSRGRGREISKVTPHLASQQSPSIAHPTASPPAVHATRPPPSPASCPPTVSPVSPVATELFGSWSAHAHNAVASANGNPHASFLHPTSDDALKSRLQEAGPGLGDTGPEATSAEWPLAEGQARQEYRPRPGPDQIFEPGAVSEQKWPFTEAYRGIPSQPQRPVRLSESRTASIAAGEALAQEQEKYVAYSPPPRQIEQQLLHRSYQPEDQIEDRILAGHSGPPDTRGSNGLLDQQRRLETSPWLADGCCDFEPSPYANERSGRNLIAGSHEYGLPSRFRAPAAQQHIAPTVLAKEIRALVEQPTVTEASSNGADVEAVLSNTNGDEHAGQSHKTELWTSVPTLADSTDSLEHAFCPEMPPRSSSEYSQSVGGTRRSARSSLESADSHSDQAAVAQLAESSHAAESGRMRTGHGDGGLEKRESRASSLTGRTVPAQEGTQSGRSGEDAGPAHVVEDFIDYPLAWWDLGTPST